MKTPETIYLQWYGDASPELVDHDPDIDPDGASWCWERIFPADIEYVRRDAVDAVLSNLLLYVSQGNDSSGLTLTEARDRIISGINTLVRRHYAPTRL